MTYQLMQSSERKWWEMDNRDMWSERRRMTWQRELRSARNSVREKKRLKIWVSDSSCRLQFIIITFFLLPSYFLWTVSILLDSYNHVHRFIMIVQGSFGRIVSGKRLFVPWSISRIWKKVGNKMDPFNAVHTFYTKREKKKNWKTAEYPTFLSCFDLQIWNWVLVSEEQGIVRTDDFKFTLYNEQCSLTIHSSLLIFYHLLNLSLCL